MLQVFELFLHAVILQSDRRSVNKNQLGKLIHLLQLHWQLMIRAGRKTVHPAPLEIPFSGLWKVPEIPSAKESLFTICLPLVL
jgi:hypothetical protein